MRSVPSHSVFWLAAAVVEGRKRRKNKRGTELARKSDRTVLVGDRLVDRERGKRRLVNVETADPTTDKRRHSIHRQPVPRLESTFLLSSLLSFLFLSVGFRFVGWPFSFGTETHRVLPSFFFDTNTLQLRE